MKLIIRPFLISIFAHCVLKAKYDKGSDHILAAKNMLRKVERSKKLALEHMCVSVENITSDFRFGLVWLGLRFSTAQFL